MKKIINNILVLSLSFMLLIINVIWASSIIDKQGRVVEEIIKPTAESTIDPDTISEAVRRVPNLSLDYNENTEGQYEGPKKNIVSNDIIYSSTDRTYVENTEFKTIRHTPSLIDLTDEKYKLVEDPIKDRLRLYIITTDGMIEAKDGFYKIGDKRYYFDEEGLMVLGKAYDTIGNYYFFSYDTGELLDEIQIR